MTARDLPNTGADFASSVAAGYVDRSSREPDLRRPVPSEVVALRAAYEVLHDAVAEAVAVPPQPDAGEAWRDLYGRCGLVLDALARSTESGDPSAAARELRERLDAPARPGLRVAGEAVAPC